MIYKSTAQEHENHLDQEGKNGFLKSIWCFCTEERKTLYLRLQEPPQGPLFFNALASHVYGKSQAQDDNDEESSNHTSRNQGCSANQDPTVTVSRQRRLCSYLVEKLTSGNSGKYMKL